MPHPRITINVNVDKIDKTRIFKGQKGRYLDFVLIPTPDSDYGDYMVKQQGERGEKLPILGNGKVWASKSKGKSEDNNGGGRRRDEEENDDEMF